MKEKLQSVQLLRGVAAILVVLFHLLTIEKKYLGSIGSLPQILKAGQSGVDLFFVISGFIMVMITYDAWGTVNPVKFLLKRFSRIYPVYWFYLCLTLIAFIVHPTWVNNSQNNTFDLFRSIFLLPSELLPLVMVAWSLIYELFFYCVFSMVLNRSKLWIITLLILSSSILVFANFFFHMDDAWYLYQFFLNPFMIEFIAGVLCAVLFKRIRRKPHPAMLFLMACLSVLLFPVVYFYCDDTSIVQRMLFGIVFSSLVFASAGLEQTVRKNVPHCFTAAGDMSYSIYLSHFLVLNVVGRIWHGVIKNDGIPFEHSIFATVALILVLLWSYFSEKYIERTSYQFLTSQINRLFPAR